MPPKTKTFYSGFIFSLAPILPDLEPIVADVMKDLSSKDIEVTEEDLVTAWTMHQLERHAHLALEYNAQKERTRHLTMLIDRRFFESQPAARDQLLSQVLPVLTHRESIPYTDRICRVWTRLPDLHMQFL